MGASTHNPAPARTWRELFVGLKLAGGGASKSQCMAEGCKKAPEVECIWADGRGRAWHCQKHHDSWSTETDEGLPRDIVKERKVPNGVVGEKYGEYPDKTAGFGVGVRGTFGVQASAADGKTTGYRDSVGLFIRLPEHLAEQFPSLAPEDNSPPHVTFLYVGKVAEEQDEVFLETVHKVFAEGMPTIKAKLIGLEHFDHPDKERRVAHCAVRFSSPLSEIRSRLRSALEDAGIEVGDSFPVYRPHVTLAYMPGLDSKYDGPVPEGEWEFDEIEVWGLPKEHRVSFHKPGKSARAIPIDKSALRGLTKRLEKRLGQAFTVAMRTKPDEPIRRQEVWARETHDIRNVMGHDLTVDVLVTAGKDRSGGPFVAAGGYGHNRRTNRPVVIVKLNGSYSPKEYLPAVDTGMLTRGIYDILIHEMTHAADAALKAKYKTGPASGQYVPDDISAYYNDPKEVRAYMQQVVDEVLRYGGKRENLEKILKLFKGPRHRGIEVVLKNTETWPEIKDHLTDSNKAKILKAVYQALDDEGYLKGASMWTMTAGDLVRATAERKAAYFGVGDIILYGKYKNKKGRIVSFGKDERGVPVVEIEPVPKGRKKNKTMGVFKIWHANPEKRAKTGFVAEDGWNEAGDHRVVLWPDNVDEESVIHTLIRPAFEQAGYDANTVTREMDGALGAEFLAQRFFQAKYKGKRTDDEGNVHYEYSPKQVEHRHREKAKRVENLRTSMPKLRKQVEKDLGSDDPKTKLTALAIALIDETYERPGNDTSAAEGHVGVTGWQAGQISFGGKGATIKYTGKSGVKHEKKVSNAKVVKALRELINDKDDSTKILSFDCEGKESCVSASDVNSYLKDFGVTAKDLRGYHANDEMKSRLRALRDKGPTLPRSRKEKDKILKKEFEEALKETAQAVGHEPATLRKDYLVPGLEDSYLHNGSVEDRHTKLGGDNKLLRFVRATTPGDTAEFFLLERGGKLYYVRVNRGSSLRLNIEARGPGARAAFDLDLENHLRGVEGYGTYTIETERPDMQAKKTMAAFDHPMFGLDWDKGEDAGDEAEQQDFHRYLTRQLKDWMGGARNLAVTKHRYWPAFKTMVESAVGSAPTLYRGIWGDQAREILDGGPLKLYPYSSWTTDKRYAQDVAMHSVGGGKNKGDPWVVVAAKFPLSQIAFAPVELPEYAPDPKILPYHLKREDEFIVRSGPLRPGAYKVVAKTRMNFGSDDLVRDFLATKEQHEKEEEEAEKLVRKEPKKKPPREDLRKERIDADDDPDLEKPNATNDRDLSHNYKGRNARSNRVLHPVEYENSMGGQFYLADVRQDRFVHFTPTSRALGILKDGKLKVNPPYQQFGGSGVYAISLVYGAYVPGTQVTHIKPDEGELVGIVFETTAVPERGYIEEVSWNRDVPLKRARIVPARQAVGMLSNTPERIGGQDQVFYKREPWMLRSAAEKQWWEGKKFPHKTEDGQTTSVGWKSLSPEEQAKFQKERDEAAVEKAKGRQKKKQEKGQRKQDKQVASELKTLADNDKLAKRIESMAKGIDDPAKLAAKYEKATGKKMSEGTAKAIIEGVKAGSSLADIAEQKGSEQAERKTKEKSEKGVRQVKRELSGLVKGADLPEGVQEKLQETFRDMSPADRKVVLDSMKDRMKENLGTVLDSGTASSMVETTDMEADLPDDLETLGQDLADRAYVQNVVLNPMMAGGNAVSDTDKSEGELEARAGEALTHFRELAPEHRKAASEKLLKRLEKVGEGSHEGRELNAILDGIALAGALNGENVPGRPPPSSLFTAVARGLEKRGEAASLLKATDLNSTEARDAMRRGISMLDNAEFAEATKDSELMEVLGERLTRKGTSVRAQREIRKMMEDLLMDDMTFIDPMVRDSLEASGKKGDALDPKKRDNIRKEIHKGVKISLGDLEGDPDTVRRARRKLRFGLLQRALEKLDQTLGSFQSMAAAMARSAIKEKDLGVLDQNTHDPLMRPTEVAAAKPSQKESSAQSAAYTPNLLSEGPLLIAGEGTTGPESPRGIRRNETMTQLLTKKGADQIQDSINRLAHVVQNNWQSLGIPTQEHAMDLAFRLDVLGDTVAKKAAQDAEHIAAKLASGPGDKQAEDATVAPGTIENDDGQLSSGAAPAQDNMTTMQNGYDPADIGKLKGPEEQDGDEPYMDAFVQDEYHQLAELQQKGMFSNAKAAADGEGDTPKAKVLAAVQALGQAVQAL